MQLAFHEYNGWKYIMIPYTYMSSIECHMQLKLCATCHKQL